jgi:hypothetical protein
VIRRLADKPGTVFLLVFVWKVALLLLTTQPVPSNDAFFYDGPVVNFLLHGRYCNPSLVHALPISGGEVFSAYPPLHQLVLFLWMKCFGPSALAAMALHVALLGVYFLTVLAIFRRLEIPGRISNLAGLFLFGITFHDRPDTVAHVFGALAVLGLVRGGRSDWFAAVCLVLTFCASLQIGGVYLLWCGLLALGRAWSGAGRIPWAAMTAAALALAGLVGLVRLGFPHLWAGFQEHLRITPSFTGLRAPALLDLLKALRTAPGIFLMAAVMLLALARGRIGRASLPGQPAAIVAVTAVIAGLALVVASLLLLTPNTVHVANYLQPVAVGAFLGAGVFVPTEAGRARPWFGWFVALSLVTGLRAIGLTTWGVACARDVSCTQALGMIRAETQPLPPGSVVIASSAYLYDLARQTNVTAVHNDWAAAPGSHQWEYRAFGRLRPARIFLTQFDYHRRFGKVVEQLKAHPDLVTLRVRNTARVPAPDSIPKFSRLVQHVAWAPVIVDLEWRRTEPSRE